MNLNDEHATVVRDALDAGLDEAWLVIEEEPADWVALTGKRATLTVVCSFCIGEGRVYRDDGHGGREWFRCMWTSCRSGRIPLAVATVEVLPVRLSFPNGGEHDYRLWPDDNPIVVTFQQAAELWTWRNRAEELPRRRTITLHRQPRPGVDYVVHLTGLTRSDRPTSDV